MRACVRDVTRAHALDARPGVLGLRTPFHKNTRRTCAPKKKEKKKGNIAETFGVSTFRPCRSDNLEKPRVKVFRGLEKKGRKTRRRGELLYKIPQEIL